MPAAPERVPVRRLRSPQKTDAATGTGAAVCGRMSTEALSHIMAADLAGTGIDVNLLLPGGPTRSGMTPDDAPKEVQATWLDPAIMGPPVVRLASAPPTARPASASSPGSSRLSSRPAFRPDKIGGVALFVISGISAAGKSTVARLLAGRFERGVCVHGDTIREMVVSGRADMSPEPGPEALRHLVLRYAGALAVARVFLDGGFDVVVEDVIIGPVLHDFLGLVPVPEVHLVFLDPDAATIRQREQARDQVAYAPDRWSVRGLQAILREQTDRIGLWLDTTGQTAEQTVEAILSDLDTSRVRLPDGRTLPREWHRRRAPQADNGTHQPP